jgi:hypothetical protein
MAQALRLFVANAVYAGCFTVLLVAQLVYLESNHLDHPYGINEAASHDRDEVMMDVSQ